MAWIPTVGEAQAQGELARLYAQARGRAGRVYKILELMSLAPAVLQASVELYLSIMFARAGLSRRERELLATVTSRANRCHY